MAQNPVPGCKFRYCYAHDDSGEYTVWFLGPESKSWASVDDTPAPTATGEPAGPRHLWDEAEAAYTWWVQAGSPTAEHGTSRSHHRVKRQLDGFPRELDQQLSRLRDSYGRMPGAYRR
jgi:hypothetical protein